VHAFEAERTFGVALLEDGEVDLLDPGAREQARPISALEQ
jgi:hypothetical protein